MRDRRLRYVAAPPLPPHAIHNQKKIIDVSARSAMLLRYGEIGLESHGKVVFTTEGLPRSGNRVGGFS